MSRVGRRKPKLVLLEEAQRTEEKVAPDLSDDAKAVVSLPVPAAFRSESRFGTYSSPKQVLVKRPDQEPKKPLPDDVGSLVLESRARAREAENTLIRLRTQSRPETDAERRTREWLNLGRCADEQLKPCRPASFWRKVERMPDKDVAEEN